MIDESGRYEHRAKFPVSFTLSISPSDDYRLWTFHLLSRGYDLPAPVYQSPFSAARQWFVGLQNFTRLVFAGVSAQMGITLWFAFLVVRSIQRFHLLQCRQL